MPQTDKTSIENADFKLFIKLWNQTQNMTTPPLHLKIAEWLERSWNTGRTRLLLMAFRSSGKSTLVGLFAAWLLYRNPQLRILVLAADFGLAKKMVRNVKRIIELHALTSGMKPDKADQWASDRFTVKREFELRDPSMLARGISSNITGSRADIVICDDVEVPGTCDTAEKRADLREKLLEISYVLVPGGTQLYVGTPHTFMTIYADEPRADYGEDRAFLEGFRLLKIPVLDERGKSAWPERFNALTLEQIKLQTGPNKFASQMMLKPVNIAEGRLDPELLNIYDGELDYCKELQTLFLGDRKLVSASGWWDPAFGTAAGDNSVLACLFTDEEGNYFLHRLEYIKIKPRASDAKRQSEEQPGQQSDEATAQCRIVSRLARALYLPSVTVETNGIGGFLPSILRNVMAEHRTPCSVNSAASTRPKDIRILEGFDAVMAARRLYVHKSVIQTPFMNEMLEWRPGVKNGRDDGLDAAAGALSQEPVRLRRFYSNGPGPGWRRGKKSHKAKTDFKV